MNIVIGDRNILSFESRRIFTSDNMGILRREVRTEGIRINKTELLLPFLLTELTLVLIVQKFLEQEFKELILDKLKQDVL